MINSVMRALAPVTSKADRAQIRRVFRGFCDLRYGTHAGRRLNRGLRETLCAAMFQRENEIESQAGGRPEHPRVVAIRKARNRLYDDLRWNQP